MLKGKTALITGANGIGKKSRSIFKKIMQMLFAL